MFKVCIVIVLVAVVVAAKEDECERKKKEIESKKVALNDFCSDKQTQDCCSKVESSLQESEQDLKRKCAPCPQYSLLFPTTCTSCTDNYVLSEEPYTTKKLNAFTACLWAKIDAATKRAPYLISYAIRGLPNEINFYVRKSGVYLMIRNNIRRGAEVNIIDGKWHAVCATWTARGGQYKIFIDGQMVARDTMMSGKVLKRGGYWALGQRQTSIGRFDYPHNSMAGEIADVNIWDEVLSDQEIRSFSSTCQSSQTGNVRCWDDFRNGLHGGVTIQEKSSCCSSTVVAT